jgi:hypothetical protein
MRHPPDGNGGGGQHKKHKQKLAHKAPCFGQQRTASSDHHNMFWMLKKT